MSLAPPSAPEPQWRTAWPGDALFGPGIARGLGALLTERGYRRALVVSDRGVAAAGLVGTIEDSLRAAGVACAVFAGVDANPTTANVVAAHAAWRDTAPDALVALGGGSVIDTAKGLVAELVTNRPVAPDLVIDGAAAPAPPFYALPTTSGTGSESSLGAVLKSPERKFVIRGKALQPTTVLLDPALTLSLPPRMTALTGFDAFCHALGAWANNRVHPLSDILALEAMRLLIAHLPDAVDNGADVAARGGVMQASWLAGICLAQVGVDGIHGLATPVESLVNVAHAEVLGIILEPMMMFNSAGQADRFARAARALGLAGPGDTDAAAARALTATALHLRSLAGGRSRLSELGIGSADVPDLVRMALLSQATQRNGRPLDADGIASLYAAML